MTAYELSEKKNKILCHINYLTQEMRENNDAGTVLLTNSELGDIVHSMSECVDFINERLKTVIVP